MKAGRVQSSCLTPQTQGPGARDATIASVTREPGSLQWLGASFDCVQATEKEGIIASRSVEYLHAPAQPQQPEWNAGCHREWNDCREPDRSSNERSAADRQVNSEDDAYPNSCCGGLG